MEAGQLESCESWEVCPRAFGGDCNDLQVRGSGSTAGFHFILQCVGAELANLREAELTGKNSHPSPFLWGFIFAQGSDLQVQGYNK